MAPRLLYRLHCAIVSRRFERTPDRWTLTERAALAVVRRALSWFEMREMRPNLERLEREAAEAEAIAARVDAVRRKYWV